MKIIIVKDQQQGGKKALEVFQAALNQGAKVFGLATGSTPETTYTEIVKSDLDFSQKISLNLDEYVGLKADNPQSYRAYMQQHLFNFKQFKRSYLPQGDAADSQAEIQRYNDLLAQYPVDLQLLGIGKNGHIGFNEPGSSFTEQTRKVKLTPSTVAANARFFASKEDVPQYAYSMGIGSIMRAKSILLEAFGVTKADAVAAMVEGPVTPDCPASILQQHPDVTVILDQAAVSKLSR
ncbi:glucosamine-6-phosphate deaminase [Liquorilactobacillus nagelii]|uniref:glucosamine-6-phosphate deaminase n=1 Tax=Liquorilactobacillus nagelii TaxID=82688 RepID=UPI0039E7F085